MIFVIVIISSFFCWFFLRLLIPLLRRSLPDRPNLRSSHSQLTPRGGGLSFVAVSSISSGMWLLNDHGLTLAVIPLLAVPLAFVGLLDDRYNLSASWRYGVQLFTAALILGCSPLDLRLAFGFALSSWFFLLQVFLLVIAVTAVINFTNFMDGIDGLVAGCMAVSIAALSLALTAPWPIWALVGSLLGFLLWNWCPAKVFMGDVGSTFLGSVFPGLVLQASSWPEAFGFLLVATPLLADACICVLRRLIADHNIFQAHRLHLFQRLHQAGWPHARVSLTYILATAVLALAMLLGGLPWVSGFAVVELFVGVWLDQHVAVTFAAASEGG